MAKLMAKSRACKATDSFVSGKVSTLRRSIVSWDNCLDSDYILENDIQLQISTVVVVTKWHGLACERKTSLLRWML